MAPVQPFLALALAGLSLLVRDTSASGTHALHHRKHHHKRHNSPSKCAPHTGSSPSQSGSTGAYGSASASPSGSLPSAHSSAVPSSAPGGSDGSASDNPFERSDYLSANGIYIGILPDNGDSGGVPQDVNEFNDYTGQKSFSVGLYAHVIDDIPFDGAELFDLGASELMGHSGLDYGSVDPSTVEIQKDALFNQVVESGAVFIASVMPTMTWNGLTHDNNTQAVRVAQALKRYTDAGVVTWLRFAHEANWYNSDSCTEAPGGGKVYNGGPENIKEGWATVAAAVQEHAPEVKMYWSPNAGGQDEIEQYTPDDPSTIDIAGIDWYPESPDQTLSSQYQWLHDKYCQMDIPFTVGETGSTSDISARQQLLENWTSEETAEKMPCLKVINWFNYNKGSDFMIGGEDCSDCDRSQVRGFFDRIAG